MSALLILAGLTLALAHETGFSPTPWLYDLRFNGRHSHLAILDHSPVDVTSSEIRALTHLATRSCELVLESKVPLDPDVPFAREALSLAARDALVRLGLGALGLKGRPMSLEDAWQKVRVASQIYFAAQAEGYAIARAERLSLDRFGEPEIHPRYHAVARRLLNTHFSDRALIETTRGWMQDRGRATMRSSRAFRRWAKDHFPTDARGVTELGADEVRTPSPARLDHVLTRLGDVLPAERTAANFENFEISLFLRNLLGERYFNLSVDTYLPIRASLDEADHDLGAAFDDDAVGVPPGDFARWLDVLVGALARGDAFVVIDPAVAWPPEGASLIDLLRAHGVRVEPLTMINR